MIEGIRYSESLVQSLERSLGRAFNQPYLRLTRQPRKPGGTFGIVLERGDKAAQADDGAEHTVLSITTADGQPSSFYFGFSAAFELVMRKHTLQHSSLIVFHDICSGQLSSLFRADWDQKAAQDTTSKHAQPHWHFVQRPTRIEGILRSQSSEFSTEEDSGSFTGLADCGRFHFAMSPLWNKERMPCHKQLFDSADFLKWFEHMTSYVAGQIDYLVSKAPSLPASEFVPHRN